MADRPRFGPAGRPPWFKCDMTEVPLLLRDEGLDAFEFQAVRMGMPHQRFSKEKAETLGRNARECDVLLSLHGPYFINLSGAPETVEKSIERLVSSAILASWMGARVVVFHPGYYGKLGREEALRSCIQALSRAVERVKSLGIKGVEYGPETTGKLSQVGSLDEILRMCEEVDMVRPVVDWAHIHAREGGSIRGLEDYLRIIEAIESRLGSEAAENLHTHFTHVEYGSKGEIRHHTLDEEGYGPPFRPLAEAIAELGLRPTIISESPILDRDAVKMKDILRQVLKGS